MPSCTYASGSHGVITLSNELTAQTSTTWMQWLAFDLQSTNTATTLPSITVDNRVAWSNWIYTSCESQQTPLQPRELTPQDAERERQYEERLARETAEWDLANARARVLLLAHLNDEQRKTFNADNWFVVEGASGTRYRIRRGWTANIDVVKPDGTLSHRLCIHPREPIPDCDNALVQKLMLESDEPAFLKVANRHAAFNRGESVVPPIRPPLEVPPLEELRALAA